MIRPTVFATLLVLGAVACDEPSAESEPSLAQRASEVRELEMLETVPVTTVTREEFQAKEAARADEVSDQELIDLTDTYGRLGYWSRDIDLRAVFANANAWAGAWYSHEDAEITLIGDVEDQVLVHEYVHALQDQHFDLSEYIEVDTSDELLAHRAVTEGDATLAELRFAAQEKGWEVENIDWPEYIPDLREWSRSIIEESEAPPFFAAYPSFAYSYGTIYCAKNLMGIEGTESGPPSGPFDWSVEDELFGARAPQSSLSILLRNDDLGAVPVGLDDVPEALAQRYERFDTNVLGAWYAYLLFFPTEKTTSEDTLAIARTWRGDRALFITDKQTGERSVLWASAWASDADAERAEAALRVVHAILTNVDEPRLGYAGDEEPVWIERSGPVLVFAKNLDGPDAEAFASAALSGAAPLRGHLPSRLARTIHRLDPIH